VSTSTTDARSVALPRADRLDALRGLAMVWMATFHLCFDLNHFGLLEPAQNFYRDPFWTWQRTAIVSLFLLCAGMGQALAREAGQGNARFWRRWGQVAGCAVLVSVGSALMFPRSWISFGVLHGIAVMLLVLRFAAPTGRWQWLAWPAGLLALVLPWLVEHPFFDSRWTMWVGLVTRKPVTEDFVPVLPWLGVMLWGYAAGGWLADRARRRPGGQGLLFGPLPRVLAPLAVLGRWPLSFYMLHQPVLIGLIVLGTMLAGR
jgi:uncharacterized membrane protein